MTHRIRLAAAAAVATLAVCWRLAPAGAAPQAPPEAPKRIEAAVPAAEADWPQFHGPRRDNISPDKGLLKQWPDGGPRPAWKFAGCGRGFAGISIAGGLMFMSGDFDDKEMVIALKGDGKLAWKTQNGKSWRGPQPGARTTPTFHDGVVYHMNPNGRLAAFRAGTGRELWAVDLKQRFRAVPARWAMSENVIIDGDAVLCAPGGPKGRVVALDKATGQTLWANTDIADGPAYCSPIIAAAGGVRQFITIMQKSVVSVDVATGKLLWTYPHESKHDQNVTLPIFRDGRVFVASGHGTGGRMLRIGPDGKSVAQEWHNKDLDNCHGGVLLLGGYLYGSGCRLAGKGFVCVDFAGGKTMWTAPALGKVSMAWADGLIYCIDDKGKVSLVRADETGHKVLGRFQVPRRKRQLALAHPVVFGGRLYIRYTNTLFAYDVSATPRRR